jgi:hypothetical protein
MMNSITIQIILWWFLTGLLVLSVICILWAFAGAFTKKKWAKAIITGVLTTVCLLWYIESRKPPSVIHMKEDVLYIHPKSKIDKDPNDIYDGSKNDPNLKQDTIK